METSIKKGRHIIHNPSYQLEIFGQSISRLAFWGLSLSPAILTVLGIVIPELATKISSSYYVFFELVFIFGAYIQHGRNHTIMAGVPLYAVSCAVIFGLWSVIASVNGPHPLPSLDKTAQWIIIAVFYLVLSTKGRLEKTWFSDATQILAIGFVVYIIYIIAWFTKIQDLEAYNWTSAIPGLWNIRQFAYYIACIYVISLIILIFNNNKTAHGKLIITLLLMSLSASLLFWSGSRGAYVGITVAIIVLLYHANSGRVFLCSTILLSLLTGALISKIIPAYSQSFGLTRVLYLGLNNLSENYEFLSGRGALWSEAWSLITTHPWSGYGPGIMPLVMSDQLPAQNHPHNVFLQFWVNWGVPGLMVGLLSFLLLVKAIVIRQPCLNNSFKPAYIGGLIGVSYLVADSMIDGTLFYSQPLMFGAFFVSLMAAKKNSEVVSISISGSRTYRATSFIARSGFLVAVIYFLLSSIAIASFYSDRPSQTSDIRAKLVRVFPVQTTIMDSDLRYSSWLTEWYKGSDKVPNEEWQWLKSHCRGHLCSLLYQAMILHNDGHQQPAKELLEKVSRSTSPAHSAYARLQLDLFPENNSEDISTYSEP